MSGVAGILHIRMYVKSVGNLNDGSRLNCHQRKNIAEGQGLELQILKISTHEQ